jgi:hypothetical protein
MSGIRTDLMNKDDIHLTIAKISNWLESNNLHVNINKTKYVRFFNRKNKYTDLSLFINGEPIAELPFWASKLTISVHGNNISKKYAPKGIVSLMLFGD